jgi:hypothetical protein
MGRAEVNSRAAPEQHVRPPPFAPTIDRSRAASDTLVRVNATTLADDCPVCSFRAPRLSSAAMQNIGSLVILALLFAAHPSAQPQVTLTGRVTLNGEPAQGRTVAFWNDQSLSEVTTLTDNDGRYRLGLGSVAFEAHHPVAARAVPRRHRAAARTRPWGLEVLRLPKTLSVGRQVSR